MIDKASSCQRTFYSPGEAVIPNFVCMPSFIAAQDSFIYQKYILPVLSSSLRYPPAKYHVNSSDEHTASSIVISPGKRRNHLCGPFYMKYQHFYLINYRLNEAALKLLSPFIRPNRKAIKAFTNWPDFFLPKTPPSPEPGRFVGYIVQAVINNFTPLLFFREAATFRLFRSRCL